MATYQDGNVRRATDNTVEAMRRSAASRRCPWCGRKSATSTLGPDAYPLRGRYCRWTDCDWKHVRDVEDETVDEATARWAAEDAAHRSA